MFVLVSAAVLGQFRVVQCLVKCKQALMVFNGVIHSLTVKERDKEKAGKHRAMERERVRHYRNRMKQNPWDYQRYVKRNRQAQRRYREKQEKNEAHNDVLEKVNRNLDSM